MKILIELVKFVKFDRNEINIKIDLDGYDSNKNLCTYNSLLSEIQGEIKSSVSSRDITVIKHEV